jgi:hypothetical protein
MPVQQQRELRPMPAATAEYTPAAIIPQNSAQSSVPSMQVVVPQQPVVIPPPVVEHLPEKVLETIMSAAESRDNSLQHGRKVMVKRRILNLEEDKAVSIDETPAQQPADTQVTTIESIDTSAPEPGNTDSISSAAPIKFGR